MALPSNHISQAENSSKLSRKHKAVHPESHEHRDTNSIYSNGNSVRAPSIVELENLREIGLEPDSQMNTYRSNDGLRKGGNSKYLSPTYQPRNREWDDRTRTTVHVSVVFLKVGEIETIKEYFEADIFIQAKWREPLLDKVSAGVVDFDQFWNPELVIQNAFSDPKEQIWHEVRHTSRGHAYIYEMRRVKGKFNETMELNDFPFDVQSISLVLSTERTEDFIEIVEDKEELSSIYVDCFADSQEWELHNFVEMETFAISSQYTHARSNYPGIIATCCVSRRAGFFSWNVLVVVNLLSIFAFSTFAVKPELTQNRLQLSFILMLSAISFRFVTNQNIPKVSYLTLLDRYLLTSLIFVAAITFWHAVLSRFGYSKKLQHDLDFWAFIIFAVGYFCFQVIFVTWMIIQKRKKIKQIQSRETKYKYKAQGILGDMWGSLRKELSGASASFMGFTNKPSIHNRPR